MEDKEYRTYNLEIRKTEDGHLVGYASVFDSWSQDLGGFREIVRPGAFTKTISERNDIRALFNHDSNYVLGRSTSGTLALSEDMRGLKVDIIPPDTQWANDLQVSMDRGDINQMSFGFRTIKDNWFTEDEENKRELLEVSLNNGDVSIVTYPAYEKTRISAKRALDRHFAEEPAEDHSEDDDLQAAKALAQIRAGLRCIIATLSKDEREELNKE